MFRFIYTLSCLGVLAVSSLCCKGGKHVQKNASADYVPPAFYTAEQIKIMKTPLEQFVALNQGAFVVSQKQKDGTTKDVFIYNVVPIFTHEKNWLYAEGAMTDLLEVPIEQMVMHCYFYTKDTIMTEIFRIKDKDRFVMGWYDREKLKAMTKADLITTNSDCEAIVVKTATATFKSKSRGLCPTSEDAGPKMAYSTDETIIAYAGVCLNSDFYDTEKKLTRAHAGECSFYPRDLTGKYYRIAHEMANKGKEGKEEKGKE